MKVEMTLEKFLSLYNSITQEDIDKNYKGLDYISWANAYRMLLEQDIDAEYEVEENENGFIFEQFGICFVKTKVTAFGKTKKMWLPIMDNNHRAVKLENMTGNQVNTSIMRCLAKNIAMFGIGLKLYVGEDKPKDEDSVTATTAKAPTKSKKEAKQPTEREKMETEIVDICRDLSAKHGEEVKAKCIDILKKYEPTKGSTKQMKDADIPKVLEEIKKLKDEVVK